MIDREHYDVKCQELLNLLGLDTKGAKSMFRAIYDRVAHNYSNSDLDSAVEDLLSSDLSGKVTFPMVLRRLNTARARRYEQQAQERAARDRNDTQSLWDRHTRDGRMEVCHTRECSVCTRHYCDTKFVAVMSALKRIASFEPEAANYAELKEKKREYAAIIHQTLIEQFPGGGFDRNWEKPHALTREQAREIAEGADTWEVYGRAGCTQTDTRQILNEYVGEFVREE